MTRPLVAVLDYGIGNLRSAQKALEKVGADARLTDDHGLIADVDPGKDDRAAAHGGASADDAAATHDDPAEQRRVVVDDRVMADGAVDVDMHVSTQSDVGGDPGTGRDDDPVTQLHIAPHGRRGMPDDRCSPTPPPAARRPSGSCARS